MFISVLTTPIGRMVIRADEQAVFYIGFPEATPEELPSELTTEAAKQMQEYFDGNREHFDFLFQQQGTEFQQRVWKELQNVKPANPISYAALSRKMNNPLAIRAIASANGKNNLMIVIPCHRIIGSDGKLVGYAGGLWRKKWLLEHESSMMKAGRQF
ncbi:methylated-DNA--[protein]-cysteine S-methyltransferase [Flavihumibacter sp. R14]|nr:methylated-DNA--[protein]-cysteine S-methyltransferase [Flavihumibacter soli]